MPRYHFNIYDGVSIPDLDGTVLINANSARHEAVALAGALLEAEADEMRFAKPWHMEVIDEAGHMLFRLDFKLTAFPLSVETQTPNPAGELAT